MSQDLNGKSHENCPHNGVLKRKNLYAVECNKCSAVIYNPVLSSQTVLGPYDIEDPPCVIVVQVYKLDKKGKRKELGLPQTYATVNKSDVKRIMVQRLGLRW